MGLGGETAPPRTTPMAWAIGTGIPTATVAAMASGFGRDQRAALGARARTSSRLVACNNASSGVTR